MKLLTLVTGPRNGGKTTRLWECFREACRQPGEKPGGFITSLPVPGMGKNQYFLENLRTGEKLAAAAEIPADDHSEWFRGTGRFWFCGRTYKTALSVYRNQISCPVLFMDEAGTLELAGGGFDECLQLLGKVYQGSLFLAVREIFLEEIIRRYQLRDVCRQINVLDTGIIQE